jgi:hypothetical protein
MSTWNRSGPRLNRTTDLDASPRECYHKWTLGCISCWKLQTLVIGWYGQWYDKYRRDIESDNTKEGSFQSLRYWYAWIVGLCAGNGYNLYISICKSSKYHSWPETQKTAQGASGDIFAEEGVGFFPKAKPNSLLTRKPAKVEYETTNDEKNDESNLQKTFRGNIKIL